jgi:hypothetical protein
VLPRTITCRLRECPVTPNGSTSMPVTTRFFSNWEKNTNCVEELHHLCYAFEKTSRPERLIFDIEFDRSYDRLEIKCRNVTVSTGQYGNVT